MNKRKTKSKTDWDRVKAVQEGDPIRYSPEDGPYDPNDSKRRSLSFQRDCAASRPAGKQKTATKRLVSLRLSPSVLDHFKATGPGWQTRIDDALQKVVKK